MDSPVASSQSQSSDEAKESDNSDNNGHDKKNNNSSDGNKTSLKYTCDTCNVNVNSTTQLSQVILIDNSKLPFNANPMQLQFFHDDLYYWSQCQLF